jgi:hypothetical protein
MKSESSPLSVPETDRSVIELELARLLAERRFAGAPQMSAFLKYIVVQTLEGNADRIKAYSVGVDALGKPDSFDAQNDPSVRVLALRLRKTLTAIYATDARAHAIVDLKVGTYVPEFYKFQAVEASDNSLNSIESENTGRTVANTRTAELTGASESSAQAFESRNETAVMSVAHSPETSSSQQVAVMDSPICKVPDPITSTVASANESLDETSSGFRKLVMLGFLVSLAVVWQMSNTQWLSAEAPSVKFASVNPVTPQALTVSPETGGMASTIPTLYLHPQREQSNLEQQLSVLLGSSFVRAGTVNVIKPIGAAAIDKPSGAYQLILSELPIQGRSRLETQVVNLDTGEVLMASTLMLDKAGQELSVVEISTIESMAHKIASITGPIYQDYCLRYADEKNAECLSG